MSSINLSNPLWKASSPVANTASCGKEFQRLVTGWVKKYYFVVAPLLLLLLLSLEKEERSQQGEVECGGLQRERVEVFMKKAEDAPASQTRSGRFPERSQHPCDARLIGRPRGYPQGTCTVASAPAKERDA